MSRIEAIARISAACKHLDDAQVAEIEQFAADLLRPTVYSTLPQSERRKIDEAIASLDRGESIDGQEMFARLRARIAEAKTRAGHT